MNNQESFEHKLDAKLSMFGVLLKHAPTSYEWTSAEMREVVLWAREETLKEMEPIIKIMRELPGHCGRPDATEACRIVIARCKEALKLWEITENEKEISQHN